MPTISVIMSVYNEPDKWIEQSIDSILNQTFNDFEFIIINDNPGGVVQLTLLKEFAAKDHRIKIIENETNLGLAASLNKGIDASTGTYIARMDADDISMPQRFELQVKYMKEHPEVSICGTWAYLFGEIPLLTYRKYKMPSSPDESLIQSVFSSPLIHPSILARSEIMREFKYDSSLRKAQDYDLWTRILCNNGKIASIPKYLLRYRVTKKSINAVVIAKQETIAVICRKKNLHNVGYNTTSNEEDRHIDTCRYSKASDIKLIESWLINLKRHLFEKFPKNHNYINEVIGTYWEINCGMHDASINYYRKSILYRGFNWLDIMRMGKRIIHKLIQN